MEVSMALFTGQIFDTAYRSGAFALAKHDVVREHKKYRAIMNEIEGHSLFNSEKGFDKAARRILAPKLKGPIFSFPTEGGFSMMFTGPYRLYELTIEHITRNGGRIIKESNDIYVPFTAGRREMGIWTSPAILAEEMSYVTTREEYVETFHVTPDELLRGAK
jgi:hypothetical protein